MARQRGRVTASRDEGALSPPPDLKRTPERLRKLADYVAQVRDALGLAQWAVKLQEDPPSEDDALAKIEPIEGRDTARLWVSSGYWDEEPEEQRATITHELLHLFHREVTEPFTASEALADLIGKPADRLLVDSLKRASELMVDRLTRIVAPHMPLPPSADT